MRLGLVIVLRDEVDLLCCSLAYHKSLGVDCFVLCDRGSTEKTKSVLRRLADQDDTHLLDQSSGDLSSEVMSSYRLEAVQEMVRVFGPDWFGVIDTDEFLVPDGDLLERIEFQQSDLLYIDRFNAALIPGEASGLLGLMSHGQRPLSRLVVASKFCVEGDSLMPAIYDRIGPKFVTSQRDFTEVFPGFHTFRTPGGLQRGRSPPDILIYHLQFTTEGRFRRKVSAVRDYCERMEGSFKGNEAWQWRRWSKLDDSGIAEEFGRQMFNPDKLLDARGKKYLLSISECFSFFKQSFESQGGLGPWVVPKETV